MKTVSPDEQKKNNPLKILFHHLKLKREYFLEKLEKLKLEKLEDPNIKINGGSLIELLDKCLEIDKYLKKKPLTIEEIFLWSKQLQKTIPFVTLRDTKEMWKYDKDNGKFIPDAETYLQSLCTNEETGGSRASTPDVLKKLILNIQGDTFKNREEFKNPANVINLNNGVYCKADGELYPHDPSYMFTYKLPFDYDPDAKCPTYERVVKNLFPDKLDQDDIWSWSGYHFIEGYPYQKYLHLCGETGAGKSHWLLGLYILLGKGNYTGFSLQDFTDRNSYATATIYGKLGNICADMKAATVNDMSMMKKLISNVDIVTTRNMYERNFDFVNSTKFTFVSNKMPFAKNNILNDDAVTRRAMIFIVNKADFEIDETIDKKIESEASGIFNRAMLGFSELLENGGFHYNKSPKEIKELWLENMEVEDENEKYPNVINVRAPAPDQKNLQDYINSNFQACDKYTLSKEDLDKYKDISDTDIKKRQDQKKNKKTRNRYGDDDDDGISKL